MVRFSKSTEVSMAKANDFTFALRICLDAIGERPKALLQMTRDALRA